MTIEVPTPPSTSPSALDWRIVAGIFALMSVVYALTASPHLQGGDAAEFALIAQTGGYAHPPGYPLFSMYLQLAGWLPAIPTAHAASLLTGLLAAAAVSLTYVAARCWVRSKVSAALCAVGFALAGDIWLFHTLPEVFALNHMLAAIIVALSSPYLKLRPTVRASSLGLTFGLGLAHHLSIVFLSPVLLYGLWQSMASTTDADPPTLDAIPVASRTLGIAGLGLAVGLLPYLYLPAAAAQQPVWAWGAIDSIQATAAHVLRLDYGIASMSAGESAGPTLALLGFWARSVTTDLMGIYPAAALIGIGVAPWHLWRGTGRPEAHIGLLCIALSLVLAGPVFGVMLSRSPDGLSIRIMRRMHLLSEWLIVIVATFGIDELARWVSRKTSIVLAALIVAAVATVGWMHTQRFHTDTVHNYILDTRDPLPDDAILVGTGDHRFFGHLYAGHVQQHRPDITYVDAQMTAYDWYRRRLRDQFDRTIPAPNNGDIDLSTLIGRLRDTGRRVCITHIFHPSLADQMRWIPMGTASCLATTPPTPPLETYHRQLAWLEAARNAPPPTPPPGSWAAESLKRYAGNFDVLQRALRASGHDNESRRAGELEEAFTPRQD